MSTLRSSKSATSEHFPENFLENLRVGDMVVIKDDNLPSNEWQLGRIDSIFPGTDRNVRVVAIRTARGIVKRPVTKVVLLPREPFKTT